MNLDQGGAMATQDSARFVLCEDCGRHGTIVTPHDGTSIPFFSKEFGFQILDLFCEQGFVSESDAKIITTGIANSKLVENMCREDLHILHRYFWHKKIAIFHARVDDISEFVANEILDRARKVSKAPMN